MKVLFLTNLPSPYRVDFFNALGALCDLTVAYERKSARGRDGQWRGGRAERFREIYLGGRPLGEDKSVGLGAVRCIRRTAFDALCIAGYSSPSMMLAIAYCRARGIPYYMESDGGLYKRDRLPARLLKAFLLRRAAGHLTTSETHMRYLESLGAPRARLHKYPFSSLRAADIAPRPLTAEEKSALKRALGMAEERCVLSVGRFTYQGGYGKGYDTLLRAAAGLDESVGVYIVGGEPTEEFAAMRARMGLERVHFVPFQDRENLARYYRAADVFALLTRGDVWGLVVNEAMANALPVVTTHQCVAGQELVGEGENGFLVEAGDADAARERLARLLSDGALRAAMGAQSLARIAPYTIENMAQWHAGFFASLVK